MSRDSVQKTRQRHCLHIGPRVSAQWDNASGLGCITGCQRGVCQSTSEEDHTACRDAQLVLSLADIPTMTDMEQTVTRQNFSHTIMQQAVQHDPRSFYDLVIKSRDNFFGKLPKYV